MQSTRNKVNKMKTNMKYFLKRTLLVLILLLFSAAIVPAPEEGMYPLSEISKIDLVKAGLKISPTEVYNPDGISLIDALVKVGGCTGSFVSEKGLIITNHHCAFGAISRASSEEKNYLENGFLAENYEDEIPAKGYKCRITESYEDVSDKVLSAVRGIDDLAERAKGISKKMQEIGIEATDEKNSIEGSVSEMFAGQTYILFKYRIIEDVRIVYAPPRSIGEFGGETDNWVWPRHTGDFTFMRAYTAPAGSSAEYSEDNVPFVPKKYLKVNPNGVEENDFVFILGYPGRTFRNYSSHFINYQLEYQLPYISELYSWMIDQLEEVSANDESLKLKFASPIKGLANTMKNYKGKLKGLQKLDLRQKKRNEELVMQEFVMSNAELSDKYSGLFIELDNTYEKMYGYSYANMWYDRFKRLSTVYALSNFIIDYAEQNALPDDERKNAFKGKNILASFERLMQAYLTYNEIIEKRVWKKMFADASGFKDDSKIQFVQQFDFIKIDEFVDKLINNTIVLNKEEFIGLKEKPSEELVRLNDPAINLVLELRKQDKEIEKVFDEIEGSLSVLSPKYVDVKSRWNKTSFIPDANGTLRLTYGFVKGYSPQDAVYYEPFTTLSGIIEKSILGGDYAVPDKLKTLYYEKDFGKFYNEKIEGVPVGLLYNMDTTGGNSGSPILNAFGELVGVNFDRAYEATINDFAWDESYSRSIGVDIRYVLWVTQKVGGANYLLEEMGI